jgi:flagellar hook-length control protein FliK
MNSLATLLQNITRLAEAQTSKAALSPNGDSEIPAATENLPSFGTFLRDLSEKKGSGAGHGRSYGLISAIPLTAAGRVIDDFQETESRQEIAKGAELNPEGLPTIEAAPSTESLPAAAQANAFSTTGSTPVSPPQRTDTAPAPRSSPLDIVQLPTDDIGDTNAVEVSNAPTPKASVIHQEGHFKPVMPASDRRPVHSQSSQAQDEAFQTGGSVKPASAQVSEINGRIPQEGSIADRTLGHIAAKAAAGPASDKVETGNFTSASILQRIAATVVEEAERASTQAKVDAGRTGFTSGLTNFKPSEGVVRILNIELHPAELGVVTVKMRLSGEKLEMELHAKHAETAELLKRDSEKLSGLLRTAGYKPDGLTIHATGMETPQQDTSFGQRQQSFSQSHSQFGGYQQGEAGGRSGRQFGHSDGSQTTRKEGSDEAAAIGPGARGIYL